MSSRKRGMRDNSVVSIQRSSDPGPRRMRATDAAHYMGVSKSTFHSRVKCGLYPPGYEELGIVIWLRDDLDGFIDRQFGIIPANDSQQEHDDPFAARFRQAS